MLTINSAGREFAAARLEHLLVDDASQRGAHGREDGTRSRYQIQDNALGRRRVIFQNLLGIQ